MFLRVPTAKNRVSGNQKIRTRLDDAGDGIVSHAAVYFNPITQSQFAPKLV